MTYAIETIDLVKRYPAGSRSGGGGGGHHHRGGVRSLGALFDFFGGKNRPYIEALRGVNLQVKEGEILGILGPNGAGKTSLIKILCTLVIHDEGEAYVHGLDVKKAPGEVLKKLQAILPESRGFSWRLSGRQNLEFYALLYGLQENEAKERIGRLLEMTGLEERADDGYQRYSTGMQRRLLLCRALLRNTPTLLFDEPTSGLDPKSAAEFRALLHKQATEEGRTILISTHNLFEAQDLCNRIAILDRGKITACDTPDNIRYMMYDEKVLSIAFLEATFDEGKGKLLNRLEEMPGILGATPEVDLEGNFQRLAIRMDKSTDLSGILELLMESGLKIGAINTEEPTLEDAFLAITDRRAEEAGKSGG